MMEGVQTLEVQNKKVRRRLLGKSLLIVSRIKLAASAKKAGRVSGKRRDEAAKKKKGVI